MNGTGARIDEIRIRKDLAPADYGALVLTQDPNISSDAIYR
jgi:hypothetical protein